jgi:hypothetical protein
MRLFMRIMYTITFSFLLIQNIQAAEEYKYPHPEGLGKIFLDAGNKEQRTKYWRTQVFEHKWWLTPENLKEFTDIKKWMEESGLTFNNKNLEKVTNRIHDCVNKMWEDARSKLENCETFKNHHNGDTCQVLCLNSFLDLKGNKYYNRI